MFRLALPLALAVSLGACSQNFVVLLDNPDGDAGAIVVSQGEQTRTVDEAGHSVTLGRAGTTLAKPEPVGAEKLTGFFSRAFGMRPKRFEHFTLYFEHGGVELAPNSRETLVAIALSIENHPGADADVYGHTDRSDTDERNDRVALARAQAVREYLVAVGMEPSRIDFDALGERQLKVPTEDGVKEPLNRRVEIVIR